MPEGFTVRLGSIEEFAKLVATVIGDYAVIAAQLEVADVTKADPDDVSKLHGESRLPGSIEVNNAGKAMLTKYAELYSDIVRMHSVVQKRLGKIQTALTETHQLYAEVDAKHGAVFRTLLDEWPTGRTGGDHGTAWSR